MSRLTWSEVVERFNVISASALMALDEMPRHQEIRDAPGWLLGGEAPLGLLFISHRWETLLHPDPTGRQLVSVQRLLGYITTCVLALLLPRNDRVRLVPSVRTEGLLQAQEIARRMMGFGTFRDSTAAATGRDAREEVKRQWERCGHDASAFRSWLLGRIGVWVDYMCMPQEPHGYRMFLTARCYQKCRDQLIALRRHLHALAMSH